MSGGFVSGIVLAAGLSRRFGAEPGELKQLAPFLGRPLVRRIAEEALASRLDRVVVVTGHGAAEVEGALEDLDVDVVFNPRFGEGKSTSVKAGLDAVAARSDAVLFLPCDQPFLTAAVIDRILWAYERTGGPILAPVFDGRRGAPVLFDRRFFSELLELQGDDGGRRVLGRHRQKVLTVKLDDELPLLDADTPEELEALRRRAEEEGLL